MRPLPKADFSGDTERVDRQEREETSQGPGWQGLSQGRAEGKRRKGDGLMGTTEAGTWAGWEQER